MPINGSLCVLRACAYLNYINWCPVANTILQLSALVVRVPHSNAAGVLDDKKKKRVQVKIGNEGVSEYAGDPNPLSFVESSR